MMKSFILAATSIGYIFSITNVAAANISLLRRSPNPNLLVKQSEVSGIPASELQSMYKMLTKLFESKNRGGYYTQLGKEKYITDHFVAYEVKRMKLVSYKNIENEKFTTEKDLVEIEIDVLLRFYSPDGGTIVTGRKPIWEFISEKHDIKKIIFLKKGGVWTLDDGQFSAYGTTYQ